MRKLMAALVTLALIVAAFAVGRASDRDETVMTVQVSSADHELLEGYFTLGDSATVMAKRGSDLYNFLSRQRGRKVKLVLTEVGRSGAVAARALEQRSSRQNSSSFLMICPTMLLGVEAPAVSPTVT